VQERKTSAAISVSHRLQWMSHFWNAHSFTATIYWSFS